MIYLLGGSILTRDCYYIATSNYYTSHQRRSPSSHYAEAFKLYASERAMIAHSQIL